uniref:Uncharacterized protein n=1 Tax=Rhizophora mucronata TaxID=61149 RepID=A0A2P2NAU4_RHIMU
MTLFLRSLMRWCFSFVCVLFC